MVRELTKCYPELHAWILHAIAIAYWANYFNGSSIKLSYEKGLRNITSLFHFISFSGEQASYQNESFFFPFIFTELQDLSFDVITESASSSVFVFTCVYQQRYHKKDFPLSLLKLRKAFQSSTMLTFLFHFFFSGSS